MLGEDGVVVLRSPDDDDVPSLVNGRDNESRRWLGPGDSAPRPVACIVVDGEVVGWVDYDTDREWLADGEVNVGYSVFAAHRGKGYAPRAVELLLQHLARATPFHTATLLIDAGNHASLRVAAKLGCTSHEEVGPNRYFKLPVRRNGDR